MIHFRQLAVAFWAVLSLSATSAWADLNTFVQCGGAYMQQICNPDHIGILPVLQITAGGGPVALRENTYVHVTLNSWTWDNITQCDYAYPRHETGLTPPRTLVIDGVPVSIQQPWEAWGDLIPSGGCYYTDMVVSQSPTFEVNLGAKGSVYGWVEGFYANGIAHDSGTVGAWLLLHNVPAAPACKPDFSPASLFPASGAQPGKVGTGYFNNDGHLDIAVTNYTSNTVSVHGTDGNGQIYPISSYVVGNNPNCVAIGDFNLDANHNLDIVTGSYAGGGLSILFGHGDGNFDVPATIPQTSSFFPRAIAPGDFNGDGNLDLAVVCDNHPGSAVSTLRGLGGGAFAAPVDFGSVPGSTSHAGVIVRDFDGDGKLDLAVTNDNYSVSILFGDGLGGFANQIDYPTGNVPAGIAAGDFNGDGKVDIAVANGDAVGPNANSVSILINLGARTFASVVNYPSGGTGVASLAIEDFNGDGKPDIALANSTSSTVSILSGLGNGAFSGYFNYQPGADAAGGMVAGDFNELSGNGLPDLVVAGYGSNTISMVLTRVNSPVISSQSPSLTTCPSASTFFGVSAYSSGVGILTYQWQRETLPNTWVNVSNGTLPYSAGTIGVGGATNSNLQLFLSTFAGAPAVRFRCVVANGCNSVTSAPVTLSICYANCDCSTGSPLLTANDFQCFLNAFSGSAATANCDGSTVAPVLTANDFQCFLNAYSSGCP